MERKKNAKKSGNWALIIVTSVCVLSVATMVATLFLSNKSVQAEFTPPPFDAGAQPGTPDAPEELAYRKIDADVFCAGICGVMAPLNGRADVWLTNPMENSVWLKLRVMDKGGTILGETGLVRPGEYIRSIELTKEVPAGTEIVLKIMAYEPDTYYSAGAFYVNTVVQ